MIYLFLPAFNEEASLEKLLLKIKKELDAKNEAHKILVINDGSTDGTAAILDKLMAQGDINLEVFTHPINRGLGETERDGFERVAWQAADDDVIVRVEGDDTHDPKYIFDLLAKLDEGYDVVNTSRFQPGGEQVGLNTYRTNISLLANKFMKLLFNIKGVKDYSCGFRAYKAKVLKDALSIYGNSFIQLKGLGFTSTLETIVKLNIMGCRFAEVPFVLRYDLKESQSKMVSSITSLGYLTMALLYHWPWGGWKSQFRGLKKIYLESPEEAIDKFNIRVIGRRTISRIGG